MASHPRIRAVCFDWGRQAPPSIPVPTVNYLPEFASLVKNAA